MALSEEELKAAKAYMRVDVDEDDDVVTQCVLGAREYLAGAGVSLPPAWDPRRVLYDLCAHALALADYDQRQGTTDKPATGNPALRKKINQLKLTEPVSELDTD